MSRLADHLDHPIVFALFITMVVLGTKGVLEWAFKQANWSGPAALAE